MRNYYLPFILFCFSISSLSSQSENMIFYYNWKDNGLPIKSNITYNDIWGYEDGTNYCVMMGSLSYNHFFDVNDPENPIEIARIAGINLRTNTLNNSIWRDYKTYSSYAYSCADEGTEGLTVYDLSELPDTVTKVLQDTTHFIRAHNIYIDEANARLYVAGVGNDIIVYGLSNPAAPNHLATIDLRPISGLGSTYIHDVFVRNNIAYCSHGYNGYCAYNLANLNNPIKLACVNLTQGYNHSSWVTDDNQYIVYAEELPKGKSLVMLHRDSFVEDKTEYWKLFKEPLLAPTHLDVTPHNPFFKEDYLYVSYYEDGVVIFDVSDPYNPSRVAYYDTYPENSNYNGTRGCWGVYPFFSNGLIAASDTKNGLFLMEFDIMALAVDFENFDVKCESNGSLQFSWKIQETNPNVFFTLEGSFDGRQFIGIQEFMPELNNTGSFRLTGKLPYKYYRMKSEGISGKTTYSNIIAGCATGRELQIFPNPVHNSEALKLYFQESTLPLSVNIRNLFGQTIYSHEGWYGSELEIPVGALKPGMYFITLSANGEQQISSQKFLVAE
jgi:choice-of-anchor B domain-containing protein